MQNGKSLRCDEKKGVQFAYILDAINLDEYLGSCGEVEKLTENECLYYAIEMVVKCLNFEVKRNGVYYAFEQYLRGLGGGIDVAFDDFSIIRIGKEWGFCKNDKAAAIFVLNWFKYLTFIFFEMCGLVGVDVDEVIRINI